MFIEVANGEKREVFERHSKTTDSFISNIALSLVRRAIVHGNPPKRRDTIHTFPETCRQVIIHPKAS